MQVLGKNTRSGRRNLRTKRRRWSRRSKEYHGLYRERQGNVNAQGSSCTIIIIIIIVFSWITSTTSFVKIFFVYKWLSVVFSIKFILVIDRPQNLKKSSCDCFGRFSNHRSLQRCRRYRRPGSMVSLSRDPLVPVPRRPLELHHRKSDSSNRASAETSSNDSRHFILPRVISKYHCHLETGKKRCVVKKKSRKVSMSRKTSTMSLTKLSYEIMDQLAWRSRQTILCK